MRDQSGREISGMNAVNDAHAALRAGKNLTPEQRNALTAEAAKIEGAGKSRDRAIKDTSSIGGMFGVLANSLTGEGPGFSKTVADLEGGPSGTDLKNLQDINQLLAKDSALSLSSAEKLSTSADKLSAAADKLAKVTPNRGDAPSPVK
jgi:hypothetical protein